MPRSQASAHQSSGSPRRSATAWAAAKVSQIGPQRRNRCSASGEGSSCPSTASVAAGRQDRRRPEHEVEGDHVAVGEAQRPLGVHGSDPTTLPAACRCAGRRRASRENPRRGESCRREQDGHEVSSGSAAHSQRHSRVAAQRPPGAAERQDALRLHHRALRRVLALAEGRRPLHRRPPRRGRLPDRRGAGPPRQHLVLDRRPLLAGARVRGLSGASAGGDRGVPQPRRGAGRRRPAVRLRPLRVRGLAGRRPRERRGHRAQPHPRAGRGLRVGAGARRTA